MRIGLFGLFGCGNSGNDASLEAMLALLRRTGSNPHLLCICPNPDRVEQCYGVDSTRLTPRLGDSVVGQAVNRLLFRVPSRLYAVWYTIQQIRKLDIIIVPGTGFLDDFQDNPFGWPFMVFKWCFLAWVLRRKIIFVSIGAGPIKHWLSRFFMKKAAQTASYRSYRDTASRQFMQTVGIKIDSDEVYPDIVFSLPGFFPSDPNDHPFTVGVGVMSYFGWSKTNADRENIYRHYLRKLNSFVTWLFDQGIHVRLLTGDEGDWPAIEDFVRDLETAGRSDTLDPQVAAVRTFTLQELMAEIDKTDAVVVTRYHNLVCALKLGRPAISLEYSQKNHALMAEMKLDEFCQNVETFDLDLLKQQFRKMLAHRATLRQKILEWDTEFSRRLAVQENKLLEFIFDPEPSASDDPVMNAAG
ncbi:MAG: polysaccharide pyruvyl transferase family protein [Phyllobacterium sp.]